ncbi:MAG TPA: non-canonical purine NTP pyrophosphatase [Coleofasciculaceae cyanobacterium]|jgi:XTP/dITP diphosphohydrolase
MTTGQTLIITLATRNRGKQLELAHWLAHSNLPISLAINEQAPEIEETGRDFIENALLKARKTPSVAGSQLVLAEDSGMVVDALDGAYGISPFPGLYSNRWMTPAIRDALLGNSIANRMPLDRTTEDGVTNSDLCAGIQALMTGKQNRAARYCCGMALWHTERGLLFQTLDATELLVIEGEPRGSNGFGYDPIVTPLNPNQDPELTMAELSTEEKNRISHRGRAFQKTIDFLQANPL